MTFLEGTGYYLGFICSVIFVLLALKFAFKILMNLLCEEENIGILEKNLIGFSLFGCLSYFTAKSLLIDFATVMLSGVLYNLVVIFLILTLNTKRDKLKKSLRDFEKAK